MAITHRIHELEGARGSFVAEYVPPRYQPHYVIYRELSTSGILEKVASILDSGLKVPARITFAAEECGQVNAFYTPKIRRVSLCYELMIDLVLQFQHRPDRDRLFAGTLMFVLLHELGHALIDVYALPVVGREEDAADQFATLILLQADGGVDAAIAATSWFANMANSRAPGWQHFANEHSLDEQRFFSVLCWIYGKDPQMNAPVQTHLPTERARRCPTEYEQMRRSWEELLAPHERKSKMQGQDDEAALPRGFLR